MMERWQKPHAVYLLMCCSEVVYVGCTSNLKQRLNCHQDKVYTDVIHFPVKNQVDGHRWERRWLIFFTPKYNHIPDWLLTEESINRYGLGKGIKDDKTLLQTP
jgi:hypothetical protein